MAEQEESQMTRDDADIHLGFTYLREDLQEVRQDIRELTREINRRFDDVTRRLDEMAQRVDQRFTRQSAMTTTTMHRGHRRRPLERLCRYVIRPTIASGRLRFVLSLQELLEKLAALVPPPRLNLVRYHGARDPQDLRRPPVPIGLRSCRGSVS